MKKTPAAEVSSVLPPQKDGTDAIQSATQFRPHPDRENGVFHPEENPAAGEESPTLKHGPAGGKGPATTAPLREGAQGHSHESGIEDLKIESGRFQRAMQLSKLAARGTGRWLVGKALTLGSDETQRKAAQAKHDLALAHDLLKVLGQMRGAAMKIGQMLSYIDDALPPEAQRVLVALQRDARPMAWRTIQEQFAQSFGAPPEQLFRDFSSQPVAAASIGQVHRAVTLSGDEVAVKIQYPGIEESMRADLSNSRFLGLLESLLGFRVDTAGIVAELEERLLGECNYTQEAAYQEQFRSRFEGHPTIVVPRVFEELSNRVVLTTQWYSGSNFYKWLEGNPTEEVRTRAARTLYRFYLGSFYLDGLFNGDPHPGNYVFLPQGRIVFLDYGCVRPFPEHRRQLWGALNRAVTADDSEAMRRLALEAGFFKEGWEYDWDSFRDLLRYLYEPYLEDTEFDFRLHRPQSTFRRMFSENPNMKRMNMPPDAVFLNRIGFGLVSILAEIGVPLNLHRTAQAYFRGEDPDQNI